jgi:dephospho-CoA kinase
VIRIGLTGSIAMGKSEVAKIFGREGIPVFDADKAVHELYESAEGANLLRPIASGAVEANRVDRKKLTAHIEKHPQDLAHLETLVHAEVAKRRAEFTAAMKREGHSIVVFDIPLLLEKSTEHHVDVVVVVSSPEKVQWQRAMARPGMTEARLKLILARQMPDQEKRKRADFVIENDGTLKDLETRTLAMLAAIRKRHNP